MKAREGFASDSLIMTQQIQHRSAQCMDDAGERPRHGLGSSKRSVGFVRDRSEHTQNTYEDSIILNPIQLTETQRPAHYKPCPLSTDRPYSPITLIRRSPYPPIALINPSRCRHQVHPTRMAPNIVAPVP